MDIFKEFFEKNPEKILGEKVATTDQFGNPTFEIRGKLESVIEGINVDDAKTPPVTVKTKIPQVSEDEQNKRLEEKLKESIVDEAKRKAEKAAKPKSNKSKKKLPKLENVMFHNEQPEIDIFTFEEGFEKLNGHVKQEFVDAWIWYKKTQGLPLSKEWEKIVDLPKSASETEEFILKSLQNGSIAFDPRLQTYVPSVLYYSGNIYEKLDVLDAKWDRTAGDVPNSVAQYNKQRIKLESFFNPELAGNIKPLKLSGEYSKRLQLSVVGSFIKNTSIVVDGLEGSILKHFMSFLRDLGADEWKYYKKGDVYNVETYFINRARWNESKVGMTRTNFMRSVGQEMVFQMNRFVDTLDDRTRNEIERKWNKEYNGFINPNYDNIPVAFKFNKQFKQGPLGPRAEQREGIAFIEAKGNGLLAFDVGVGKTMTAILAVAQALDNGDCKRPLIVVPKPTLKKWISEIHGEYDHENDVISHGIIPNYPLINISNLNKDILDQYVDPEKGFMLPIPEKSITICTYQALDAIGFSDEAAEEHFEQLQEMLLKSSSVEDQFATEKKRKATAAARQKEIEALQEKIGVGQAKAVALIDEIGWDYLVVDEAHNFSKVFESVRNKDKSKAAYEIYQKDSKRAVKLFFMASFIQRVNNYRNICLLTATPFNNNPLEVYGLLAVTDYGGLKNAGVNNIVTFFDNFIDQTYENAVTSKGTIEVKAVIKGWTNKVALQKLIFNYMNYKSGKNVKRPNKHVLPKLNEVTSDGIVIPLPHDQQLKTFLMPTARQKFNQKEISKWLTDAMKDPELRKGAPLKAAGWSMANTLSPDLYENAKNEDDEENSEVLANLDPIDLIEESPKLKYTMRCIESIIDHHKKVGTELSNVIIYANRGVFLFHKIKQYLIDELGYLEKVQTPYGDFDQVEIIAGTGQKGAVSDARKEACKTAFNEGYVKVIIGSGTIREGIDLQGRTSTLFNLWCDWNPTDYKQLEGRLWRYGNMYHDVRVVTPLGIGGSDAFVWQKLEEKTGRINDIFDQSNDDNILDVSEEDREAIKWALVEDVRELAKMMVKEEVMELEQELDLLNNKFMEIKAAQSYRDEIRIAMSSIERFYNDQNYLISLLKIEVDGTPDPINVVSALGRNKAKVKEHLTEKYSSQGEYWVKSKIAEWETKQRNAAQSLREYKVLSKKIDRTNDYIISQFGEEYVDNIASLKEKMKGEFNEIKQVKIPQLKSDENINSIVLKIEGERKRLNAGVPTFEETINAFTSLNYLLDQFDKTRENPEIISKADPKEKKQKKPAKKTLVKDSDQLSLLELDLEGIDLALSMEENPEMIKKLEKDKQAVLFTIEMEKEAFIEII